MNLGGTINTGANDRTPALSRDGHYLFFASDRPGGLGGLDLWISWRANTHDIFGWESPMNLGVLNSPATDGGPSFFENDDAGIPQLYVTSSKAGGLGGIDIYVSALIGPRRSIWAWSSASGENFPSLSADRTSLFFSSDRPGGFGATDLYVSTRPK